ncbi:MAG: hypothetical protein INF89_14380, partial [Roseomonas sp.]|nr:hypothetical protein [Roseomonas sp.]
MTTQPAPLPAPGTTHSPAPWRVRGQALGSYITVKAANGRTVARVPWNGENTPPAEYTDARDALTIALAPELLAALEDMVALVQERFEAAALSEDEGDDLTRRFDRAKNLIAEA